MLLLFSCKSCYIFCSFHNYWEDTLEPLCHVRTKLWHWRPSLQALYPSLLPLQMVRLSLSPCWSLFYSHFSELSQLTLPNLFAAMWWFVHAPCYYSSTCVNTSSKNGTLHTMKYWKLSKLHENGIKTIYSLLWDAWYFEKLECWKFSETHFA